MAVIIIITLLVLAALAVGVFYAFPAGRQPRTRLSAEDREYYATSWKHIQGSFVDDPVGSLQTAEVLMAQLLRTDGQDEGRDDAQALRARFGDGAERYRTALETSRRVAGNPASTSTEDMRVALMDFHAFSEELLGESAAPVSRFSGMRRKVSS